MVSYTTDPVIAYNGTTASPALRRGRWRVLLRRRYRRGEPCQSGRRADDDDGGDDGDDSHRGDDGGDEGDGAAATMTTATNASMVIALTLRWNRRSRMGPFQKF
jgi:hypothetical protein